MKKKLLQIYYSIIYFEVAGSKKIVALQPWAADIDKNNFLDVKKHIPRHHIESSSSTTWRYTEYASFLHLIK